MKAVISVVGADRVGILAKVSSVCLEYNVNIIDVSQTVLQSMFTMAMLVDISGCTIAFADFCDRMKDAGKELGMTVHCMHEDIFNSMHRI